MTRAVHPRCEKSKMTPRQAQPFVLTLKMDASSFATFDDLRRRYFPSGRNAIPAHVTLFQALPGE